MTTSPTHVLYRLAGSPPQEGCTPLECARPCRICAAEGERGALYARWQGASFTDQNKIRDWSSDHICEPCVWAHAWSVPPGFPPPEPGKKGVNLRLYSHLWHDGEYRAWNKANKAEMRAWLASPKSGPWFAAIADSGQKHVLPWTPMNRGHHGAVRFEERNVTVGSLGLIDQICELLTAGVTKEEVESGHYGPRAWDLAAPLIQAFEAAQRRGGGWFALALWLAQRDEQQVQERMAAEKAAKEAKRVDARPARKSKGSDGGRTARAARGVPADTELQRTQALGPAARPNPRGGAHQLELGGMAHSDDPKPGPRGSKRRARRSD